MKRERTLRARAEFEKWLAKYYLAKQHPLTVEALWAAWQQGYAAARKGGRKNG